MSNLNNIKGILALLKDAHDQPTENLNEIVQEINKGCAFTVAEAEGNLNFIVVVHEKIPELLEEFDRMQCLESELIEAKHQVNKLKAELQSSRKTKQTLQRELKQMEKHSSFFLCGLTS